jgi:hypothetical protein
VPASSTSGAGYPDRIYRVIGHPVTWMGALIAWADRTWNSQEDSPVEQRTHGIVLMIALVLGSLIAGLLIQRFLPFLPAVAARPDPAGDPGQQPGRAAQPLRARRGGRRCAGRSGSSAGARAWR